MQNYLPTAPMRRVPRLWRVAFVAILAAALLAVLSPNAEAQSADRPDQPGAEFIFKNGRQHLSMSWTDRGAPSDAWGSVVQVSTDLGTTWTEVVDYNRTSAARWDKSYINGAYVTKDSVYDVRVAWKLSYGRQSPWSQVKRLDERTDIPRGNIYEVSRTADSVTIGWTYPAGYTKGANAFQFPADADGKTYQGWAKYPNNRFVFDELRTNTEYTLRIDAYNTDNQKVRVGDIKVTLGGGNDPGNNARVLFSFPDDAPLRGWWDWARGGASLNFNTIGSGEGRALRIYQNTNDGGAGVGTNFTASNWSRSSGLSMRFKGNNSGETVKFEVRDNGQERFLYSFSDTSSSWRTVTMPFGQFERSAWQLSSAPNDGFTKTGVVGIRIIPDGGSTEYQIDNIALTN